MDPLSLGRKLSNFLQEFVDGNPKITDWFAPHSTRMSETGQNQKTPETVVEQFFHGHCEKDRDIEVLKRARTVAPEVREDFEMAVMQSKEEDQLEAQFWMRAALRKAEEMKYLKEELTELQEELDVWRTEAKALASKALEKDLAIQAMQRKAEADRTRLERAHKIEYEELTMKVQRTGAFLKGAAVENLRTALRDTESKYCQLVKELSETHLRSVESAPSTRGVQIEGSNAPMNPQKKRRIELECLEQYVDKYKPLLNHIDDQQVQTPGPWIAC